jgi:hypothetical protein
VVKKGGISEPSGIVVADVDGAEQVTVIATQALVTFDGETGEELDRLNMVPEADSPLETPFGGRFASTTTASWSSTGYRTQASRPGTSTAMRSSPPTRLHSDST